LARAATADELEGAAALGVVRLADRRHDRSAEAGREQGSTACPEHSEDRWV
jgi:hypothetical protein